ncbi:MAG: InlB B-repeat-containing protein [Clostridia bacterium]|nr:InlB B-repeat-containing protein [Clostridia bacterium]
MRKIKLILVTLLVCLLGLFTACNVTVELDYNIDFIVDGVTVSTVGTDGQNIKMPENPTKENYVFDGWYWDEDEWEEKFTLNSLMDQPLQEENHYKVYAKWRGMEVTITYNDGEEKTQVVTYDEDFALPIPTAEDGDIFLGWQITEGETTRIITDEKGQSLDDCDFKDVTATPAWKEGKVVLTLDAQGSEMTETTQILWTGEDFELPVPTVTNGDIFLGWKITEGETTRMITDEKGKGIDPCDFTTTTATPAWKEGKVVLTFDAQGGEMTETSAVVWFDEEFGILPTPKKDSYDFVGWGLSAEAETVIHATDKVALTEDTTVYAIWTKQVIVKLSFDGNGNTAGSMQDYISVGITQFTLPKNTFTKVGYTFGGWQFGDTMYEDKAKVSLEIGEYTLKAIWNAITYTVEFQKGAGEGTMPTQTFTYNDGQALSANAFTRKGYLFGGWSLGGETVVYQDGAVRNFATTDGAKVVLTAIWTPITYRVYYKQTADTPNAQCQYLDVQYDEFFWLSEKNFIKKGYKQVGWTQLNGDFVGKEWSMGDDAENLTSKNGEAVELVARWEAITYDIRYSTNFDGKIVTLVRDIPYDEAHVLLDLSEWAVMQREGYVFDGWRLYNTWLSDEYEGKVFQPGDTVKELVEYEDEEIEIFAEWKPITYTVNVHIENAADTILTAQKTYDEDLEFSLDGVDTAKANYTLQGFRVGHNALGIITWKNAVNIRKDYCAELGGTVDIYPLWKYNYQGEGTQESPYLVDCADAMENMAIATYLKHAFVSKSEGTKSSVRVYFSFTADIDMTGRKFTPIGFYDKADFYGEIQGNGHTVSALNICTPQDITDVPYLGFVSYNFGKISNLSFKDSSLNVTADQKQVYVGFMTGMMYSAEVSNCVLENCTINVTNTGAVDAGAFQAYGSYGHEALKDVFFKGDINVNAGGEAKVGTVARVNGTMDTCAAQANVQITAGGKVSFYGVGGTTSAQNCYSVFHVTAQGTELTIYESGYEYNSKLSNIYYSDASTITFNGSAVALSENGKTADANLKSTEWVAEHIPAMRTTGWTMENGYPQIGERALEVVEITTQAQFLAFSGKNLTERYVLKCDIDMTGATWEMPSVYGEFDGNGHTISNYTATILEAKALALFENNYGTIKNVVVNNVQIMALTTKGDVSLAGLVVDNKGTVAYCKVSGSLMANIENGKVYVGGIAALNNGGWIYCCYTDCTLDGSTTVGKNGIPYAYVFGIAYNDGGVIEHCYTAGNYNASANRTTTSGYTPYTYIGGVSNVATNSFSFANLTYTNENKKYAWSWAVATGLEACSSQTVNGTALSGINEMYLKNEAYLAEKFGWKKYMDAETLSADIYAAWTFSANARPVLYFE